MKLYLVEEVNHPIIGIEDILKIVAKHVSRAEKVSCFTKASLILVTNEAIAKINKEYRQKDYATDVLSFPSEEKRYLGEVFISMEKAIEQAKEYNHSIEREFVFLLVHGLLHLLGYDHINKEDEEIMFLKQEKILEKLPYRRNTI